MKSDREKERNLKIRITYARLMLVTVMLLQRAPGEQSRDATVDPDPVPEILNNNIKMTKKVSDIKTPH